jgi:UDP-2,3-diacylglucosamine hydrolase
VTYLFISDLHLSPNHPRLVRGFLDLLQHYENKNTQLYILGDWFNAWIGDDDQSEWLDNIVSALKQFTTAGNQVFFLIGNRDFALGQAFLNQFNGRLLKPIDTFKIGKTRIRIEHGDLLCTDDVSYQRFRKIIRHPLILGTLKRLPLSLRQKIANGFRQKSQQANQVKSYAVMDVNTDAVEQALHDVDLIIHGHTHRAYIHDVCGKKRIVLGDWKEDHAEILELDTQSFSPKNTQLKIWHY